jgi:SAM-dependent methyltransferase
MYERIKWMEQYATTNFSVPEQFRLKFKGTLSDYQDIELINFIGVGRSSEEWDIIKNWIDWEDKKVADLSCFYGYFSFKIVDVKGKPTGFDTNDTILERARALNVAYNKDVQFVLWKSGQVISEEYEVALCLDCFQYYLNKEETLQNIKSKIVIFDVEEKDVPLIQQYYDIVREQPSHRGTKIVLLGVRK